MSTLNSKTTIVKPSNKHDQPALQNPVLDLHKLDTISGPVHIANHRFFKPLAEDKSFEDLVEHLQSSLAEALELYPPVAGTVQFNDNSEWIIVCDNSGAPFTSQQVGIPFAEDDDAIVSARPQPFLETPAPVFAVKVTRFSCGTIAVATSMHHLATDLAGSVDFLHIWSRISRSKPIDFSKIPKDWTHDPAKLFGTPTTSSPAPPPPGYRVLPAPPTEAPFFSEAEAQTWTVSLENLTNLKNDLSPKSGSEWISSSDALSALLWGVITRARQSANIPRTGGVGRSSEESGVETLAMAADGRNRDSARFKSRPGYFGNLNLLFQTTCSRADLLETDTDDASRVALAIRKALAEQLSPEAIPDRVRFFEEAAKTKPPGHILWSADTIATNWSAIDFEGEDMSFGWGKPFETTSGGGSLPGGFFRIMQKHDTHTYLIVISVEKDAAEAMKDDALLRKYAHFEHTIHTNGSYA